MKLLKGSLTETLYNWPCQIAANTAEYTTSPDISAMGTEHTCSRGNHTSGPRELQLKRATIYAKNEVTYMSDRLGLHSVGNPSKVPGDYAVSLHLYTV